MALMGFGKRSLHFAFYSGSKEIMVSVTIALILSATIQVPCHPNVVAPSGKLYIFIRDFNSMVTAWCADSYSRMAWRYGTLIVCSWLGRWVSSSYSGSLASKLEILIGASVPDDGFADFMPGTWCDLQFDFIQMD